MTAVIDVGAARYGGDYSVERLIELYRPDELWAYDPNDAMDTMEWELTEAGPTIHVTKAAVWTEDGEIGYRADGLNSWVTELRGAPRVRCVDIDRIVREAAVEHASLILKIDAEGAEYELLRRLIATGADQLVTLAVVEWHEPDRGRALIEEEFLGRMEEWTW